MKSAVRTIHIQADAPRKPLVGSVCNGCGVCCLAQPCPLGILLSLRRKGPCAVLRWDASNRMYRCGAIVSAPALVRRMLPWLTKKWQLTLGRGWVRFAKRSVAAGRGCDCHLEPQ